MWEHLGLSLWVQTAYNRRKVKKQAKSRPCFGEGVMPYSIYESINENPSRFVNAFVAPIQSSAFHWHNEYELIGVLKGSITVRVQSELVCLKKGDLLLVNSNVIHAIDSTGEEENLCMLVQMRPDLFVSDESDPSELLFYLNSTDEEEPSCGFSHFYKRMAKIVYQSMREEKHAQFRVRAEACGLIADLFDYVVYDVRFRDKRSRSDEQLTVSIIEYLENNLSEEQLAEMTCHEFGVSRKTLDRNLKQTLGVTGKEIVDRLRMDKAKELLKNTNKTMSYILDACGFGSEKTFYRMFRQETGVTPKEFRESGSIVNENHELRGYLDFEAFEVKKLLQDIIKEEPV